MVLWEFLGIKFNKGEGEIPHVRSFFFVNPRNLQGISSFLANKIKCVFPSEVVTETCSLH